MKKLTVLIVSWACVFALGGCRDRGMDYIIANEPKIAGVVKDTGDTSILIENEEGGYRVSLDVEVQDSMTHFSVGDEVVVYYDGTMTQGDPVQIDTVYAITLRTPAHRTENDRA